MMNRFKVNFLLALMSVLPMWADTGVILNTTVEYQSPAEGFLSTDPWNAVWHFKDSTYFVWVDAQYRPWISQVTGGVATTVPLDVGTDYDAQPDGHHRFSLGIDKDGYIHVTGDMHHYYDGTTAVANPYPLRYQKQTILYWKSNQPQNVLGGFSFAGGLGACGAIPGGGWLIGRFFADNTGVLYYASQTHAYESATNHGQMAVGLYQYKLGTKTWISIGGIAPHNEAYLSHVKRVFYWEESGQGGGWFQNYQPSFKFDINNHLHFALTGNTDSTLAGANRILYAVSKDAGATWHRANGSAIAGFPLRGVDGFPNTADVVAETKVAPFFSAGVGLVIDKNGTPGIGVSGIWRTWNGSAWDTNNKQNGLLIPANYGYRVLDNSLIFTSGSKIMRTGTFETPSSGYDFLGYSNFTNIDEYGLRATGILRGLGFSSQDQTASILKTVVTPAPLPEGWSAQDIASTLPAYGGTGGFLNGVFVATNYGSAIDDASDSFYFIYKSMVGDGSITARVNTSLSSPEGYCRLGLMMRNSLDANSANVNMIIAPGTNNKGAQSGTRSTAGSGSYTVNAGIGTISTPYWVRIVRAGSTFTSYISPDGSTWTQVQSVVVSMNQTIYVGLASCSYTNGWFMQRATFDHVTLQ